MELKPVDLYYEEVGEGIPIVLLHGFPLDHTIWSPVARLLTGQARVIMPDMRGYGRSPDGNEIHSMRLLVEDVLRLLDRLNIEHAILIGHSMGGYVSLTFAHAYPGRLAGLGLAATQADPDTLERRQARLRTARDLRARGSSLLAHGMPSKLTHNPELQKQLEAMFETVNPQAAIRSLKGMAERQDANPWLGEIHAPTLVIAGGQDQLIPVQKSHEMVAMLNKGWLIEIPEAGHLPMLEAPEQVAEGISQLISAVADN